MIAFKDYVINEYKVENCASTSFKFSHSLKPSIDKKTNKAMNTHTVNVEVKLFDKDLNLLHKDSLRFTNNVLNKKKAESLVNISPIELENRFNAARREIVCEIQKEYLEKRNDIENKINSLMMYENVGVKDNDIISSAYKGELVQMKDANNKQVFDM
jgi:hypothetical protein